MSRLKRRSHLARIVLLADRGGEVVALFRRWQRPAQEVDRTWAPPTGPAERSSGAWSPRRPAWMIDGVSVTLYGGTQTLEVVGESRRQENLWAIVGHGPRNERVRRECYALLVPETENPYDENAITVWVNGLHVGYLSRADAMVYRAGVISLMKSAPVAVAGEIVGGGRGGPPMLGVFLHHDPADFGIAPAGAYADELRTGLSEALLTDLADDCYDLSWMQTLSQDSRRAIG